MALKIEWSNKAEQAYLDTLDYLYHKWSEKEVISLIKRPDEILNAIIQQPYGFKQSSRKNIRKAVINKQNSIFYRIENSRIYLLAFWDNRQNPSKNPY
jgi:plasmid stabilization system protein ParE